MADITTEYFLPGGYAPRLSPTAYRDESMFDASVFQLEAYQIVRDQGRLGHLLESGCGLAVKGVNVLKPATATYTGTDLPEVLKAARKLHPSVQLLPEEYLDPRYTTLVSIDVIEHLLEPGRYLAGLAQRMHPMSSLYISTPNRGRVPSLDTLTPENPAHVREWTTAEFVSYVQSLGFVVRDIWLPREAPWLAERSTTLLKLSIHEPLRARLLDKLNQP